ncbi:MAG TPA: OmpA family protein [Methylomirabilota bacterium]|jgi:outer membrane protein OmpA-like peptidoglycan-associated protein|nr:OmpA family protein [Methylomirabilota bacterium]
MRRAGFASLALLLLAGCAKPARDDLYVLLPGAEGKTGALSVDSAGRVAVLDQPYAAARVKEPGRVEPGTVTEQEAKQAFGSALEAQPGRPISFLLYFLEGRDELTPESQQIVSTIPGEIARRPAPEVVVIGHTDRVGTLPFNDALSLRRAARVRDELVKAGIAADRIRVEGRGEREPLVPTADEVAEPRNRRVEVNVR